jgi:quercetin dioxygenase-like cupin family protein
MTPSTITLTPVAEQLWFLDTLVTIRVPHEAGEDGLSVIESVAPLGDAPPLHVHRTEDELFQVLEGELLVRVGDEEISAPAGAILLAPKGVPHSYRVVSADGARWLVTTTAGDFEAMVRAASRAAERADLPEPAGPPSPEQVAALSALCADHGIDLVGPPLS